MLLKTRYRQTYHIQLAITPGPSKSSLNTFLMPILAELHYLEQNGMLLQKLGEIICRAKVYLVLNGGDIPAINLVSHVAPHQNFYPCRICVQKAEHPENRNHDMYLRRTGSELRTLHEYTYGDPHRRISGSSIFSGLDLYSGLLFYPLDEMHTILRGVGSLLLDMLNVDNTIIQNITIKLVSIRMNTSVNCTLFSLTNIQWLILEMRLKLQENIYL